MKVKELIAKLQEFDPELEVCIFDPYEIEYFSGEFDIYQNTILSGPSFSKKELRISLEGCKE